MLVEQNSPFLSIVSPVYKAETILPELLSRLEMAINPLVDDGNYEIVLVDDCSPDNSWDVIRQYGRKDVRIKGIKLSRNFGQHYAITCGLDFCTGKWVVVMDCDLQDRPEEIAKLLIEAKKGYDIVFAKREDRKDSLIKKSTSFLFYKIFSYLSGIKQDGTISNFGIYSRKAINAVNKMREPMRAFSPMMRSIGFDTSSVSVTHAERFSGKSSYDWSKLINLAIDISLAYSDKPLKLTLQLGFIISFLAGLCACLIIVLHGLGFIQSTGYTGVIVSLWFLSGLIIFTLGVIGLYVGKTFDSVKNRPLYFVDKKVNFQDDTE